MTYRRAGSIAAAVAVLISSVAAFAQTMGTVTTVPVHGTPALGTALLVILAVAMGAAAMYRLRRKSAALIVGFVLVVALAVLAGLGYAGMGAITISGAQCAQETISPYPSSEPTDLVSDCVNLIQIIDIEPCGVAIDSPSVAPHPPTTRDCFIGEILDKNRACQLPPCL